MQLNAPAPDFSLPDLTGKNHRLRGVRGRIAVVNFWSAECSWVERVDRELLALQREWGQGVILLTVAANLHEPDELLAETARRRGLAVVLRGSPEVVDAYRVETTPHLFVVDVDGVLRYAGAFDDVTFRRRTPTRSYLKEAVEALLSGRLPDQVHTSPYGCAIVRYSPDSC